MFKNHKQYVTIYKKRWYYRLVSHNDVWKSYTTKALMDDYKLSQISQHTVICFTPTYIPGIPDIRNKTIRLYGFFDSYVEFYSYMKKFPLSERSFYEIIFGEFPQKPHFDIDIDIGEFSKLYPTDDITKSSDILRESIIMSCEDIFEENLIPFDVNRDILLYSSHGENKISYHIIINNKCHNGNKEAKAFYDAVIRKVSKYTNNKYTEFVDKSVYSSKQQFRMVGSQKKGSKRPKVFYEQFIYKGKIHNHTYNEHITDDNMKKLIIVYESMISFTSGCLFIPSLITDDSSKQSVIREENVEDLCQEDVKKCMKMLRDNMKYCPFTVKDVVGNFILLNRNAPSLCPICNKQTPHENENPFIFVIENKVYWDCRRSPVGYKKFFIGFLNKTIHLGSDIKEESKNNINSQIYSDKNTPVKDKYYTIIPEKNALCIPIEKRMKNVQDTLATFSRNIANDRYVRNEPEDLMMNRRLIVPEKWTPGLSNNF